MLAGRDSNINEAPALIPWTRSTVARQAAICLQCLDNLQSLTIELKPALRLLCTNQLPRLTELVLLTTNSGTDHSIIDAVARACGE